MKSKVLDRHLHSLLNARVTCSPPRAFLGPPATDKDAERAVARMLARWVCRCVLPIGGFHNVGRLGQLGQVASVSHVITEERHCCNKVIKHAGIGTKYHGGTHGATQAGLFIFCSLCNHRCTHCPRFRNWPGAAFYLQNQSYCLFRQSP